MWKAYRCQRLLFFWHFLQAPSGDWFLVICRVIFIIVVTIIIVIIIIIVIYYYYYYYFIIIIIVEVVIVILIIVIIMDRRQKSCLFLGPLRGYPADLISRLKFLSVASSVKFQNIIHCK